MTQQLINHQSHSSLKKTIFFMFFLTTSTLSLATTISASTILERQALDWLGTLKSDVSGLIVQANDSRLQIPICDFPFQFKLRAANTVQPFRTFSASCETQNWQRTIRLKVKKTRTPRISIKPAQQQVTVFSITHGAAKYEQLNKSKFTKKTVLVNAVPTGALKEGSSLAGLYAKRPLRAGQIITSADVMRAQKVVVLKESVSAQALLDTKDLKTAYRLKNLPHDAVQSLSGMQNLAANRLLHAGDILRKRDLTKAKLVKRGDLVLVEAKSKDFQIVSEAFASQDGYFGEQITLKSADSKRHISARVSGLGRVQISSKSRILNN